MTLHRFSPHGEYSFKVEGQILNLHKRGPWNKELIDAYAAAMGESLAILSGQPWGLLATISEDGMHTPESLTALVDAVRAQKQNGRRATAILFNNVYGEAIVRSIFQRMYDAAGETYQFFDDEQAARTWLEEQIALPQNG